MTCLVAVDADVFLPRPFDRRRLPRGAKAIVSAAGVWQHGSLKASKGLSIRQTRIGGKDGDIHKSHGRNDQNRFRRA